MNFIEKIKYRINYYQDGMNKTNGVDNISQEKINELQWILSELKKEEDRKKCCNCNRQLFWWRAKNEKENKTKCGKGKFSINIYNGKELLYKEFD
jgi:hypothetical protein